MRDLRITHVADQVTAATCDPFATDDTISRDLRSLVHSGYLELDEAYEVIVRALGHTLATARDFLGLYPQPRV